MKTYTVYNNNLYSKDYLYHYYNIDNITECKRKDADIKLTELWYQNGKRKQMTTYFRFI